MLCLISFSFRGLSPNENRPTLFRAYDAVLEALNHAKRLYTEAGPQGLEGLERIRDPVGLVKTAAMRDGQRLKGEAVAVLRWGERQAVPPITR